MKAILTVAVPAIFLSALLAGCSAEGCTIPEKYLYQGSTWDRTVEDRTCTWDTDEDGIVNCEDFVPADPDADRDGVTDGQDTWVCPANGVLHCHDGLSMAQECRGVRTPNCNAVLRRDLVMDYVNERCL